MDPVTLLAATIMHDPQFWEQSCPVCHHKMRFHDDGAQFAICEELTGPYGGKQCKCNYATEALRNAGQKACAGFGLADCEDPSHVICSDEWWRAVLWDEGAFGNPEAPCRSKQDVDDDELLEFFAPSKPEQDEHAKVLDLEPYAKVIQNYMAQAMAAPNLMQGMYPARPPNTKPINDWGTPRKPPLNKKPHHYTNPDHH